VQLKHKGALLAGVSTLALAVADPALVGAADLPVRPAFVTKAPALPPAVLNWWVEGGASHMSGDPYVGGFSPAFDILPKRWGAEGAAGFDYRFDAVGHLSGQFRYGRNKVASRTHNPRANFSVPNSVATPTISGGSVLTPAGAVNVGANGSGAAQRKEEHWLADFMVGRDMNIGKSNMQGKLGVRVASIDGNTTGSASWNVPLLLVSGVPTGAFAAQNLAYTQQSKFVGVGPRAALDGSVPLGGAWSLDYNLGVAALFGDRKLSQTASYSGPNVNPCLTGCPGTFTNNSNGAVLNFDAQPGISYAFSQNVKLTASYRFDGYWNVMRVVDSTGNATNVDRLYQGASLRLGVAY
jgi:hypothetical protein